jgi:hypothetical protein
MHINPQTWQWTALMLALMTSVALLVWLLRHRKPTAEELERERRLRLVSYGRLVDGMLVELMEVPVAESFAGSGTALQSAPSTRWMLLYQYEIAGVTYECAQDVTVLSEDLQPGRIQVGLPCSVRYQPGSPENSIVVAETWSGLRNIAAPRGTRGDFLRPPSRIVRSTQTAG